MHGTTLLFQFVSLALKAACFCLAFYLQSEHSAIRWYLFVAHDLNAEGFFRYDSLTASQIEFLLIFFFRAKKHKNLTILK